MRLANGLYLSLLSKGLVTAAYSLPSPHVDAYDSSSSTIQRTWLARARDSLIESIWPATSVQPLTGTGCSSNRRPDPPSKLLARYGGDLVLRFKVHTAEEVEALAEAVRILLLDVWEFTPEWVDIRLSKDVVPSLLGLLPASLQSAATPLMHDLAQAIYESYPSLTFRDPSKSPIQPSLSFNPSLRSSTDETNIFFRQYQPLSVIHPWMRLLRSLFPTHVRLISLGLSYEGREIHALRVGVHPTNDEKPSEPRKTVIVAGGSHAREWISTSTVNYVAYSFITTYGRSKDITKLLESFDFVFIPTLNPDGYVYTWENDRLWRKNRQQTPLRFCKGLDLDRSFGYQWDKDPDKNSPCSESFPGESPFDAVEARHFAEWAKNETENNNVEFAAFLDFHSYSQQVLYPYSFSCTTAPPLLEDLEELAIGLAKAIRTTTGEAYGVTSACEGSVPVTCREDNSRLSSKSSKGSVPWPRLETGGGSALDWFYHELKVPFAYQVKLRDTGTYGFLLPSSNIVPTGKEAFKAVEYLGNFLMGNRGVEEVESVQGIHDTARLTHPNGEGFEVGEQRMTAQKNANNEDEKNGNLEELKKRRK